MGIADGVLLWEALLYNSGAVDDFAYFKLDTDVIIANCHIQALPNVKVKGYTRVLFRCD